MPGFAARRKSLYAIRTTGLAEFKALALQALGEDASKSQVENRIMKLVRQLFMALGAAPPDDEHMRR